MKVISSLSGSTEIGTKTFQCVFNFSPHNNVEYLNLQVSLFCWFFLAIGVNLINPLKMKTLKQREVQGWCNLKSKLQISQAMLSLCTSRSRVFRLQASTLKKDFIFLISYQKKILTFSFRIFQLIKNIYKFEIVLKVVHPYISIPM